MRDTVVALVSSEARGVGEDVLAAGGDRVAVARAAMETARRNFMAPDESEAFAGAVAALWAIYPDDESLRQETRAVGDGNRLMGALLSGVPVDLTAWEPTPMPDDAIGLLQLWHEVSA